jgi:hypothetical protein
LLLIGCGLVAVLQVFMEAQWFATFILLHALSCVRECLHLPVCVHAFVNEKYCKSIWNDSMMES